MQPKYWKAPKMWADQTVFVIGGGTSLRGFDWTPLHDKRVIGCNDAYRLGPWVDICAFGDWGWHFTHAKEWVWYKEEKKWHAGLRQFQGMAVGFPAEELLDDRVHVLRRVSGVNRFSEAPSISWFLNTGASAVNLAWILGANRVILLGFDMKLGSNGQNNWHPNLKDPPDQKVFARHQKGFDLLAQAVQAVGIEVLNAGPDSVLPTFPHVKLEDVL